MVLGLVLVACGDDDDGDVPDAGRDAAVTMDAAMMDAATDGDGGATDGGADDGGADDGGAGDGAMADAGGAFVATLMLTTAQEVPPCAAAGASAMGTGNVRIDAEDTSLELVVTYSGLSGPVTMGHIHLGAPGMAGPAILPFTDLTSPIMETFTEEDYPASPPAGAPADWAAFLDAVRAGDTYVNLHTAACAPGEIRDQID